MFQNILHKSTTAITIGGKWKKKTIWLHVVYIYWATPKHNTKWIKIHFVQLFRSHVIYIMSKYTQVTKNWCLKYLESIRSKSSPPLHNLKTTKKIWSRIKWGGKEKPSQFLAESWIAKHVLYSLHDIKQESFIPRKKYNQSYMLTLPLWIHVTFHLYPNPFKL